MQREQANLEREFCIVEQSYGTDQLDLVLANGYLGKLLENARIIRYLAQHHQEISARIPKVGGGRSSGGLTLNLGRTRRLAHR
jgi:hypothetical protein